MLKVESLNTHYGNIQASKGIDLVVNEGEIVALVGNNGAGKSTLLNTVMGLLKHSSGKIFCFNKPINNLKTYQIIKLGLCLSPEGREIFPSLTTENNLILGSHTLNDKKEMGLAPNIVTQIFNLIKTINKQVVTILLVEQNANIALKISNRCYLLETDNIVLVDKSENLLKNEEVKKAYLGLSV